MFRVWLCFTALGLFIQASVGREIFIEDLVDRLENLEQWKRDTEKEIGTLRDIIARQEAIIERQSKLLETYETVRQENGPDVKENKAIKDKIMTANTSIVSSPYNKATKHQQAHTKRRDITGGVAFTAYLSRDINPGPRETLKFNQVITNEGMGYNNYTGSFTCPKAGVYLFSFFLGERGSHSGSDQIWAELVVNDRIIVSGATEARHDNQDLQGGNMAVVRLNLGDTVWVEATSTGSHLEGDLTLRYTTFTGAYLFA